MARPLRIQFPGALYHLTSRGNAREAIYLSNDDRRAFLRLMGEVAARYHWRFLGYCLMGNHYHLIAETLDPTLARGMRQLNGEYTRRFNNEHRRVGHLFQGRYAAILVERETQLMNLVRYVVLNPVRAGLTARAETWMWSSHRATAGTSAAQEWLAVDAVLRLFGDSRAWARHEYARFVEDGMGAPSVWIDRRREIFLGSEAFVGRVQAEHIARAAGESEAATEVPRVQRLEPPRSLGAFVVEGTERRVCMARAFLEGGHTLSAIARHFGVHYSTVSRAVRRAERRQVLH